jgi:hypothetical protein
MSWLFTEKVGPDFARECTEIYYESQTFVFNEDGIMRIRDALRTDPFHHGIVPAQHLRPCEVNLSEDDRGGYFSRTLMRRLKPTLVNLGPS